LPKEEAQHHRQQYRNVEHHSRYDENLLKSHPEMAEEKLIGSQVNTGTNEYQLGQFFKNTVTIPKPDLSSS
jgi:hypothetical protein